MAKITIIYRNDCIDVADGPPAAYHITFTRPDGTAASRHEEDAIIDALGIVRANPKNLKRAISRVGEEHQANLPGAGEDDAYTVTLRRDDGKSFAKHEASIALAKLALQRYEAHRAAQQTFVCVDSQIVEQLCNASAVALRTWIHVVSQAGERDQIQRITIPSDRGAAELVELGVLIPASDGEGYEINGDMCFQTTPT